MGLCSVGLLSPVPPTHLRSEGEASTILPIRPVLSVNSLLSHRQQRTLKVSKDLRGIRTLRSLLVPALCCQFPESRG